MVKELKWVMEIPGGIEVKVDGHVIHAKGPKGEVSKKIADPRIDVKVEDNKVILNIKSKKSGKKEKMIFNTLKAHIKNIVKGVQEGYEYKLKICSGHFPMTASIEGDSLVIKNFLGEKFPRKTKLVKDVKAEVKGDIIILQGPDKEYVGTCAGKIELATKISNRDRRVFQDGIYLIEKEGKAI